MSTRERLPLPILIAIIIIATLLGPAEKTLGDTARIIYIHGAMVWVAILTFAAAAAIGLMAIVTRREDHHRWCRAAGRVALLFWLGYLPLSMWAARVAWGRVFLQDPSFQRAFRILAVALIVQVIIWLQTRPRWLSSVLNLIPFSFLIIQQATAAQIMHPDSPIGNSDSLLIRLYFYILAGLCVVLAILVGRRFENSETERLSKLPK